MTQATWNTQQLLISHYIDTTALSTAQQHDAENVIPLVTSQRQAMRSTVIFVINIEAHEKRRAANCETKISWKHRQQ